MQHKQNPQHMSFFLLVYLTLHDLVYLFALTSGHPIDVHDDTTLRHGPTLLDLFPHVLTDWKITRVQSVQQQLKSSH